MSAHGTFETSGEIRFVTAHEGNSGRHPRAENDVNDPMYGPAVRRTPAATQSGLRASDATGYSMFGLRLIRSGVARLTEVA